VKPKHEPVPENLLKPLPPRRTGITRRSGTPRTGMELLKRLLDMGCTYERIPASAWAVVRYRGLPVGSVHCADGTDINVLRQDLKHVRGRIWIIKAGTTATRPAQKTG
jgi:hypothetical protein